MSWEDHLQRRTHTFPRKSKRQTFFSISRQHIFGISQIEKGPSDNRESTTLLELLKFDWGYQMMSLGNSYVSTVHIGNWTYIYIYLLHIDFQHGSFGYAKFHRVCQKWSLFLSFKYHLHGFKMMDSSTCFVAERLHNCPFPTAEVWNSEIFRRATTSGVPVDRANICKYL